MKNQIFKIVLVSFIALCFFNTVYGATLNIETTVDVPASCTITDTDGVTHNYGSPGSYLAICALDTVVKNGSVSKVDFSNKYPSFGLFIAAINSVPTAPNNQYWAIFKNTDYSLLGVTSLTVVSGDTIVFQFTTPNSDFSNPSLDPTLDQVTLHIASAPSGGAPLVKDMIPNPLAPISATTTDTNRTTTPLPAKISFDIKKASDFLTIQQKDDGSFGSDLYTDWTALALASGNNQTQVLKLVKYLGDSNIESSNLTDYERHAMAFMALGLNPYNTNGENYIEKITSGFDGKQFGDTNQDNDDIFALIVLQNAGYKQDDPMINTDISFILGAQNANGSWDGSVDMTGAAIEALSVFNQNEQVKTSLSKAENFLKQNQKENGSWGDSASSTAWALEGILALNEKPEDWVKNGNTPFDYLASIQDTDGGVKDESINNKIWKTSYVVSALSGKTWNQIMQKFEKPAILVAPIAPIVTEAVPVKNIPIAKVSMTKNPKPENVAKNLGIQNTASVINAVANPPVTSTTESPTPKRNWFMRILGNIFGF